MKPTLSDVLRTFFALPLILLLWALGKNQYLFAPVVEEICAVILIAAGLGYRVWKKKPAHVPFWLTVFLSLYNFPMSFGGFIFMGWAAFAVLAFCFILAFAVLWKSPMAFRLGLGVILATVAGMFFLHFFRNLDFDRTFQRCAKDTAKMSSGVSVMNPIKHVYDFASVGRDGEPDSEMTAASRDYLVAAYGQEHMLRWYDEDDGRLLRETRLNEGDEVQRIAVRSDPQKLYLPPWSRWGENEAVLVVNARTGRLEDSISVRDCRNLAEVLIDEKGDRLYALCEVSHSLVSLGLNDKTIKGTMTFPGRDAYDMALDPQRRRLFISDFFSPYLFIVNADRLTIEKKIFIGWSSGGILFLKDRVYVTLPLSSAVLEIDAANLAITRRFETGRIPRDLDADVSRDILFVGNYLGGTVSAIDLKTGRTLKEAYAGMLLRGILYQNKTDRLYLATGCGIKMLSVKDWLYPN